GVRREAGSAPPLRAGARRVPRRVVLVQGVHAPVIRRPPRHGARHGRAEEVASFEAYSQPLLDAVAALPPGEQAVLVGHSFGGQSLAL
ncbi:unnamed protein product, partial [Urochloa humidicola]